MLQEIMAKKNQVNEDVNTSAQIQTYTETIEKKPQSEEFTNNAKDELIIKEESAAPIQNTQNEEYLNQCHNYVFNIQAAAYLRKVGLYLYIDKLQIGYDIETKEIILPLDGVKGSRYFAIKLKFDNAADEVTAQKVLQYYNLKPNETAKWNLYKDAEGKLINGGKNYDNPYNELGKKMIKELK